MPMGSDALKHVKYSLLTLVLAVVVGTVGYSLIEGWPLIDSFYMTVITVSTTGFKEVYPLSHGGQIFTVFLIIAGVSAIAYTGGRAIQYVVENQVFRRRRMSKKTHELKDHYIVCGYGRMGRTICDGLFENKVPFVVVENDPKKIEIMIEKNLLYINGDATSDEVLLEAGIKQAKGLVAVVRTDAENVFATLSARELNPKLFIVARGIDEGTESKLKKAGADRVVLPYELGGNRMFQLLMRPSVIDFIESVARTRNVDINLEEIKVEEKSTLIGHSLADSPVRKDLNIIIVSVIKQDGQFIYNPKSTTVFENGDKLIAIGESQNLSKLAEICVG